MQMQAQQMHPKDFSWPFWPAVPLYPYGRRRTLRHEVVPDRVWTFDQLMGILYVVVPIRMTIVKLDAGGLLVYGPVAPTPECVQLVRELETEHGQVKYIIFPTISGLEHKVFVGPFARRFRQAQVFVAPHQWSFPLNLPLSWLGFPPERTSPLPEDSRKTPFADQFDYAMLTIDFGRSRFGEVAFLDKRSGSLMVTDIVVSVPEDPPAIAQLDPYPLLFHAKDNVSDLREDNWANRRQGWQRICLFAFYFQPSKLSTIPWSDAFRDAKQAPDRSLKAYGGLYPFQWQADWRRSFDALRGNGRPLVAPILQTLILNRAPRATMDWVNQIASWDFQRIIPCHLQKAIGVGPEQFRQAFSFLKKQPECSNYPLPQEDFQLLQNINAGLQKFGILPPAQDKL